MTLQGKQIVITRAAHQAAELAALLTTEGAQPILYPAIRIAPPADLTVFDAALRTLSDGGFDWIVLTSANAVQAMAERLQALRLSIPDRLCAAAVGAATAAALRDHLKIAASLIPAQYDSAHLLEVLPVEPTTRVLLPQSEIAPPGLADALHARGAQVTTLPAYRVLTGVGGADLPALVNSGAVDAITFTSASTVNHFFRRFMDEGGTRADLAPIPLVSFSGSAAHALTAAGFPPRIAVEAHTLPHLIQALKELFHAA